MNNSGGLEKRVHLVRREGRDGEIGRQVLSRTYTVKDLRTGLRKPVSTDEEGG